MSGTHVQTNHRKYARSVSHRIGMSKGDKRAKMNKKITYSGLKEIKYTFSLYKLQQLLLDCVSLKDAKEWSVNFDYDNHEGVRGADITVVYKTAEVKKNE